MIGSVSLGSSAAENPTWQPAVKDRREVAGQFEALLIAQMLRTMRESSSGGWLGTGEDQAGEQAVQLAEEAFAQALAQQGGLGMATIIRPALEEHASSPATAESDSTD